MKRLIRHILIFILPLLLLGIFCTIVLYSAGELFVKNNCKPLQDDQLIGLAYTDINAPYKYEMTRFFQPDVVALGSSRIMQVKGYVVNDTLTFYNAGGAAGILYEYELFLDMINYSPKLFFISLDQWAFNPNYLNQKTSFNKDCYEFEETGIIFKYKNLLTDFVLGKIDLGSIFDKNNMNIGLNGKIKNSGFLKDGSYYYGGTIANPTAARDYNFKDTYERIDQGRSRFQYCAEADTSNLVVIDSFLSKCTKQGITVIAILPPFAPLVCEKMDKTWHYNYMSQVYGILSPVFDNHPNCYLYDYTDMRSMGVHDYDFVDGFHGSDIIYNLIIQDIIIRNHEIENFFISKEEIDSINNQYNRQNIRFHSFE